MHTISCSGTVTADDFENWLVKFYRSAADPAEPLLLDFAKSAYIDIPALINLIALAVARKDQNQETYIGVSQHKAVRDLLRVWSFPEAFRNATGVRFENSLVTEDQNYRGESQTTYRGSGTGIDALEFDADWKQGHPGRKNFFEFTTYNLQGTLHPRSSPAQLPDVRGHTGMGR